MPLLVVGGDPVEGTDTHIVSGTGTNPGPPPVTVPYAGTGRFDYVGSMTDALSDLVSIDGTAVALTSSASSLDPGQDAPPAGGHSGPAGSNFLPTSPVPEVLTLRIEDPVGTGTPNAAAGSAFITVGGTPVLLDGDPIDTCDGQGVPANSTVTASTQDLVSASG